MILSIVTINYNNAEGLRKTLASVASQTYPHIEHIIVDGGSSPIGCWRLSARMNLYGYEPIRH